LLFTRKEQSKVRSKNLSLFLNISNWLSGGALYRYQRQVNSIQIELRSALTELKGQNEQLQQTQLQLEKTKTQLQMSQLELEQAQIQFQQTQRELLNYKQQIQLKQSELEPRNNWETTINQKTEIVELKRLPLEDPEALWGYNFAAPKSQTKVSGGAIIIRGWVLGKRAKAKTLEISCNGQILEKIPINQPSKWLTKKYPNVSEAENSYFETAIAVNSAPAVAELLFQVVLADKTAIPLAICRFQQLAQIVVPSS
jgi:hypothetical protein